MRKASAAPPRLTAVHQGGHIALVDQLQAGIPAGALAAGGLPRTFGQNRKGAAKGCKRLVYIALALQYHRVQSQGLRRRVILGP